MRIPLALAAVVVGIPLVAAPAQAAAPAVQITRIWYDSPGSDRGGNSSVNAEYIRFKNTTRKAINLQGWYLRDNAWRYTFGKVTLRPGKIITLRSGQGKDTTTTLYWGRRWYVWNNDKDRARLYTKAGKLADSCAYNNARRDYINC